jgi:hypothetical protein
VTARWPWLALAVPVIAAGVVAAVALVGGDSDDAEPVELQSDAAVLATLDELVAASDAVVIGTVTAVSEGRVLTAPADTEAGLRTRLIEIDVERTLAGTAPDPIVVEEPAALLDGTPVVVDGMTELAVGDRAAWFLVEGTTADQPYHAAVGPQGRFVVDGDALTPTGQDGLSSQLAAQGLDGLVQGVLAATMQ